MAFATHADVATQLGRTLTSAEQNQATAVIGRVEDLILEAAGRDDDWAAALEDVPATFTQLCVDKAIATITNPSAVASQSETLGEYQHSETFPRAADIGVRLSPDERREARRAAGRAIVTSPRAGSVLDDVYPLQHYPIDEE